MPTKRRMTSRALIPAAFSFFSGAVVAEADVFEVPASLLSAVDLRGLRYRAGWEDMTADKNDAAR